MSMGRLFGSLVGAYGGRMLGGLIGGNTGRMIGSLAGSMLGSRGVGNRGGAGGGLGDMLGGLLGGNDDEKQKAQHAADQIDDGHAELLIRAMCNSAKADGQVDQSEIDNIVGQLGDVSSDEDAFLRAEFARPLDAQAFIASVPDEAALDVYTVSLLAVEPDHADEIAYLDLLATGLGIPLDTRKQIHESLGITNL